MKSESKEGRVDSDYQSSIRDIKIELNKGGNAEFCSHKVLRLKLRGAWVTKEQYFKILKVFKDLGVLNYSPRGIRYRKVKEDE